MSETGTGTPPGKIQSTQDAFEQMLAADEGENEQLETEVVDEGEEALEASDGESEVDSDEVTESERRPMRHLKRAKPSASKLTVKKLRFRLMSC
jgi:hypothetical protein